MIIKTNSSSGSSLVEVMVVAGIMTMILTALVNLSITAYARNSLAKQKSVATRLAQEGAEYLRHQRDKQGFDQIFAISEDTNHIYCLLSIETDFDPQMLCHSHPGNPIPHCAGNTPCGTILLNGINYQRLATINLSGTTLSYTVSVRWGSDTRVVNTIGELTKW